MRRRPPPATSLGRSWWRVAICATRPTRFASSWRWSHSRWRYRSPPRSASGPSLISEAARRSSNRLAVVGAFFVVFIPASFSLVLALEAFVGRARADDARGAAVDSVERSGDLRGQGRGRAGGVARPALRRPHRVIGPPPSHT